MKKTLSKMLALILVFAAMLTMVPTVFAARTSLETDTFSFTVGKGMKFKEIGLPETIYSDKQVLATVSWNTGSYDAQKEGTYTVTGTAKLASGGTQAVKAYVTVKDCGFRLPAMTEMMDVRATSRRSRSQFAGFKKIGCTPLFEGKLAWEDYTWNYRWYLTSAPGVPGKLYSTDKDVTIDKSAQDGKYYYCKVTGTRNGVSTTLTSRFVYVSVHTNEELMSYRLTASVDEVIPGKDFQLTATAGLRRLNGSFEQFYWSGVDNYMPHFEFSSTTPGVSFSEDYVIAPRGVANVTVHTAPSVADLDKIDLSVHVTTKDYSKIYYVNLTVDDYANLSLNVVKEPEARQLSDVTDEWYSDGVRYMLANGFMRCEEKNKFGADTKITRAEIVTTLYRCDGFKDVTNLQNNFSDVSADEPYVNPILWATSIGIIAGKNNKQEGTFDPDGLVTRQEFATILYRYAGNPSYGGGSIGQFSDASEAAEYAQDALRWAVYQGYLTGNGNRLEPKGYCTRGQIATILSRYFNS